MEKEKRRDDSQEDDSRGRKDSRAQERSKEQERSRSRERSPAPPERRDLKARPSKNLSLYTDSILHFNGLFNCCVWYY